MSNTYYIYIMASQRNGTIYIGMTNNLQRRVIEHRNGTASDFTRKYNVNKLVYFDYTENVNDAIAREAQLKNWHRKWKLNLIEKDNPNWEDLSIKIFEKV
jgi:putative endonuclease